MKDVLRYIVLAGTFLIPFIPLVVTGSLFFPYITGKNFYFRIIVEIMLVAWVPLMLMDAKYRPRFSWILGSVSLFVGVMLVANVFAEDVFRAFWSNYERMEGWVTLAHLLVYFLISISILNTEKLWRAFWNTSIAVAGLIGVLWLKEVYDITQAGGQVHRASINFGNPTYLAIYNVFHVFIALVLSLERLKKYWLLGIYGAIALMQVVMLYYTATRGSILGLIAGIGLTGLLIALFERKSVGLRNAAIGMVLAAVAVVGGFYAIKDTDFVRDSTVLNRFATITLDSGTAVSRLMIWNMAYEGFQERPLLGWGQEGFVHVFNKYLDPNMYAQEPWFDRTHNVFFDWLIAGGILGFIAYFTVPAAMLYYLWFYKRPEAHPSLMKRIISSIGFARHDEHPMSIAERALWTGMLAAYFVHNLFVFDNLTSYLLYIAMLAYVHVRVTSDRDAIAAHKTISPEVGSIVVFPFMVAVMIAFGLYSIYYPFSASRDVVQGLRLISQIPQIPADQISPGQKEELYRRALDLYTQADEVDFLGRQEISEQFVQAASRIAQSDAPDEIRQQFIDRAGASMERQIARVPNDARTLIFMGQFLSTTGATTRALEYFERAREASPTKQSIYFEIGSRHINLGNVDEAVETFRTAFELAPSNIQAREFYALGLIYDGRIEEAEALFVDDDGEMLVTSDKYFVNEDGVLVMNDDRFLRSYEAGGHHDRVLAILRERLRLSPASIQAHVSLAAGYAGAGNDAAAIETLEAAIELDTAFEEQGRAFIEQVRSGALRRQ